MEEREERFRLWPGVKVGEGTFGAGANETAGARCVFFEVEYMTSCSSSDEYEKSSDPNMSSAANLLAMSSMGSPYGSEMSFLHYK